MKSRIGIVGGGQLGRMLGFAAKRMGFIVSVMDPTPHSPAGQVVDLQLEGDYSDPEVTEELAGISDFITVEIEHINTDTLKKLASEGAIVNPAPRTIEMIKNKLAQKEYLAKNKIPTAKYLEVSSIKEIETAAKQFGFPFLLKAKLNAFDGRGNALIKRKEDIAKEFMRLGGKDLYVEKYVPFVKELAVVIARDIKGKLISYPVVETIHKNNICHIVMAPAPINKKYEQKAKRLATRVMNHLKGAGVFAIEMFLTKKGEVLINEIAPRVHNSGHYTIEACYTSQFEQHIRAVTGLPLGNPDMKVPAAVMINILGERKGSADVKNLEKALRMSNVSVHLYGKAETKLERKMGHITVVGKSVEECLNKAKKARKTISI